MKSTGTAVMLLALAILCPMLIQGEDGEAHSRGEIQRGDPTRYLAEKVVERLAPGFSYPPESQIQSRQYVLHPQPQPQVQSYRPQQSSNAYPQQPYQSQSQLQSSNNNYQQSYPSQSIQTQTQIQQSIRPSNQQAQSQRPAQNPSFSQPQSNPYYNRPQPPPNYNQPQPPPNYNQPQSNPNYSQAQPKPNYNQPQPNSFSTLSSNRLNDDSEEFTRPPPDPSKTKAPITTKSPPRFDTYDSVRKTLTFNRKISEAMERFATVLLSNVNFNEEAENFMISPFSVYHMLVMIAEGSRQGTFEELKSALEIDTIDKTRDFQQYLGEALRQSTSQVKLKKFAMMVTDQARPVLRDYEEIIEKVYDGQVEQVDFRQVDATQRKINDEVSKLTEGQITDVVSRDDLLKAQLILISGLFFQASWANVFNKTFTKREPFHDTNGNQVGEVNMMFQRGTYAYSAVKELGCHILELPYAEVPLQNNNEGPKGTQFSMILVLPRKGLNLTAAIDNIWKYGMEKIYTELQTAASEYPDEEVEVHIPRFEIDTTINMKSSLEDMKIKSVFEASTANLEGINKNYFISAMIHKTKFSVDEKGTTAAAVTTSVFANKATPPKFHANKPFLFFIVDKATRLVMFSGQYSKPSLY